MNYIHENVNTIFSGTRRSEIFYNLKSSKWVLYNKDTHLRLYFSSKFYMQKFIETFDDEKDILSYRFKRMYKCNLDLSYFYDIVVYSKIEKRGFYITLKGESFECLNNIILTGEKLINKK